MEWLNVIMHPDDLYEMLIRRKLISGASAVLKTLKGISPLTITKIARKGIKTLTQFGKCEQSGTPTPSAPINIKCNNGALKWDSINHRIYIDGTPETLTVESETTQTASVENLFGVGDYKDEQNIISGVVARACGIKVLYGTEEWTTDTYGGYRRMVLQKVLTASGDTLSVICSHYISRSSDARQQPNSIFIASSGKMVIYVDSTQNFTTVDEFNAWLAEQYANGTPVIVVYPLAETTTEQVTAQHLSARDTATITANSDHISNIELEVEYWETAEE